MKTVREAALRERVAEAMTLGNADIVQRIGEFLIEGRDAELHGIRPGKFARDRGLNRTKTVKAFLQLTKTGVFDLRWTVHCPHCKGGSQDSSSLAALTRDAFCPLCQQGYEADFDRSVELSFQVNPAVVSFEGTNPFDLSIGAIDLEPGVGIEIGPAEEHYLEYPIALGNYLLLDRADRVAVNFAVGPGKESAQEISLSLVKEHFKIMEEVVRRNDGGIVKTIGDAVMAVFRRPDQAIAAAREMIEGFDAFNLENRTKDQIIIKVGVHVGPCIAVTLNERIDYFGTSVNTAARIQGLSDGRDVMVSERFFRESGAAQTLAGSGWSWESFTTSLKGLSAAHEVYKLVKA